MVVRWVTWRYETDNGEDKNKRRECKRRCKPNEKENSATRERVEAVGCGVVVPIVVARLYVSAWEDAHWHCSGPPLWGVSTYLAGFTQAMCVCGGEGAQLAILPLPVFDFLLCPLLLLPRPRKVGISAPDGRLWSLASFASPPSNSTLPANQLQQTSWSKVNWVTRTKGQLVELAEVLSDNLHANSHPVFIATCSTFCLVLSLYIWAYCRDISIRYCGEIGSWDGGEGYLPLSLSTICLYLLGTNSGPVQCWSTSGHQNQQLRRLIDACANTNRQQSVKFADRRACLLGPDWWRSCRWPCQSANRSTIVRFSWYTCAHLFGVCGVSVWWMCCCGAQAAVSTSHCTAQSNANMCCVAIGGVHVHHAKGAMIATNYIACWRHDIATYNTEVAVSCHLHMGNGWHLSCWIEAQPASGYLLCRPSWDRLL